MNELGSRASVWRLMEIILVEARSSVEWFGIGGIDGILWFLKYTCTHEKKYTYVIHISVFSYMYTCLLTTERAKFYTLGSKNRFLYPYFNYFSFIYLLYKCVSTSIPLCVRKMEGDLWVSGPTLHSIGSKDQTPVIRFGRKWFQPLRWLSLLLPQVWISNINPPPLKGNHVFSVLFKCHRMEMLGFQGTGQSN